MLWEENAVGAKDLVYDSGTSVLGFVEYGVFSDLGLDAANLRTNIRRV